MHVAGHSVAIYGPAHGGQRHPADAVVDVACDQHGIVGPDLGSKFCDGSGYVSTFVHQFSRFLFYPSAQKALMLFSYYKCLIKYFGCSQTGLGI
jgi:hypothetical protein